MKVKRNLSEVRKSMNTWGGGKQEGYVKYESSFTVLERSVDAILIRIDVSTSVLTYQFMLQNPTVTDEMYTWKESDTSSHEVWIPFSCINGDPDQDEFRVQDWIGQKNDALFNLVPYNERSCRHQDSYKVYSIQQIDEAVAGANTGASEKVHA